MNSGIQEAGSEENFSNLSDRRANRKSAVHSWNGKEDIGGGFWERFSGHVGNKSLGNCVSFWGVMSVVEARAEEERPKSRNR